MPSVCVFVCECAFGIWHRHGGREFRVTIGVYRRRWSVTVVGVGDEDGGRRNARDWGVFCGMSNELSPDRLVYIGENKRQWIVDKAE